MDRDKILDFIRFKGPIIPVQVSKYFSTNILFASAMLSELVSANKVKMSRVKIGGSPLYYVPGQEERLQDFSDKLHDKEQKAYALLKEKKVLRDSDQEPFIRAALRQIKDFAFPLEVHSGGKKELFWKWYLLPEDECSDMIKKSLGIAEEEPEEKKTEPKEEGKVEDNAEPKVEENREEPKSEPAVEPEPREEKNEEPKLEERKQEPAEGNTEPKEEKEVIDKKPIKKEKPKLKKEKKPVKKDSQKKLKEKKEPKKQKKQESDEFAVQLREFFEENNISIIEENIIKKSEIDYLIEINSPVGSLSYYCKAKNKKRVNDGDLSSAYVQGQLKKMPIIFVTPGELTKRAKEMLENELKGLTVKKL